MNLSVNWGTILVGLRGPGKVAPLLSESDAVEYAQNVIEKTGGETAFLASDIAYGGGDAEAIKQALFTLAKLQGCNLELEERKWRLVLLKKTLAELGDDPIYDLIRLTEFWEQFDYPEDSPHQVQGRNSSDTPENYYTHDNFDMVLKKHKIWIREEELRIRTVE
jgi:hypothetical protein